MDTCYCCLACVQGAEISGFSDISMPDRLPVTLDRSLVGRTVTLEMFATLQPSEIPSSRCAAGCFSD
jgi:hypothetical protein